MHSVHLQIDKVGKWAISGWVLQTGQSDLRTPESAAGGQRLHFWVFKVLMDRSKPQGTIPHTSG